MLFFLQFGLLHSRSSHKKLPNSLFICWNRMRAPHAKMPGVQNIHPWRFFIRRKLQKNVIICSLHKRETEGQENSQNYERHSRGDIVQMFLSLMPSATARVNFGSAPRWLQKRWLYFKTINKCFLICNCAACKTTQSKIRCGRFGSRCSNEGDELRRLQAGCSVKTWQLTYSTWKFNAPLWSQQATAAQVSWNLVPPSHWKEHADVIYQIKLWLLLFF